jgi:hypothetical protein
MERAMTADPKKKSPFNFQRSIIANCKVYETPGAFASDKRTLAFYTLVDEVIEIPEGTVKKL